MSSTIAIPTPRSSATGCGQSSKACTSSSSSFSSPPHTPASATSEAPDSAHKPKAMHLRRPSLLSSAFAKEECTHINVGDPDGPPRLISYLASSQGFAWNPEMFLPSYLDLDYEPLENCREPVHEIRLSDEEMKNMLP
ncbi:hypothetical protein SAMD00023353_9300170 [Rosellinia necatrix]|uniref:Uncharacterized protein n=1 Tax=Rosellinia necatrix TaxID=77044 RepID=A0A1W2TVJ6_ROSNE|nr:hypothetical protein SAMD00023353_9300170 [Rosellinia necatrix]